MGNVLKNLLIFIVISVAVSLFNFVIIIVIIPTKNRSKEGFDSTDDASRDAGRETTPIRNMMFKCSRIVISSCVFCTTGK